MTQTPRTIAALLALLVPLLFPGVADTAAAAEGDPDAGTATLRLWGRSIPWPTWLPWRARQASGSMSTRPPAAADAFDGIALADSITVDPCKLLFTGFGLGCLLVRDTAAVAPPGRCAGLTYGHRRNFWL